ncbi:MAG: sugar phosphate isomerase/epimerase [Clostridia bacterium]|nr:sugar phosphate isomerase/epimerase [Clostridia bacterium]
MRFTFYTHFNGMAAREGTEKAADWAAEHGFSAVELLESAGPQYPSLYPDRQAAEAAKKILAARGLSTACYSVGTTVYKNPEAVASLKRQAEIAAALDCPFLHHTLLLWLADAEGMPSFEEGIACAVEAAAEVADYAKTLGVRCIYEDQGMYANGVEGFGAFYRQIKQRCDNVGVCGDMGNSLFVDEGAERFFAAYAGEICHVHVKDYLIRTFDAAPSRNWYRTKGGRYLRETMVGDGDGNVAACMDILKKAGYSGTYALELCHPEPFEAGVCQAMEYLRRWED